MTEANIMGQRIRECRIKIGLTQEELGAKLGVQSAAVRKYECGLVQNIPRKSIETMAKLFDVRPSWLMGMDNQADEEEANDIFEVLRNRKDLRVLFSTARTATPEDIERAVAIINALKASEDK